MTSYLNVFISVAMAIAFVSQAPFSKDTECPTGQTVGYVQQAIARRSLKMPPDTKITRGKPTKTANSHTSDSSGSRRQRAHFK